VLSDTINLNSFKTAVKKADQVLTLLSCLAIPALIGGSVVMVLEKAPDQHFVYNEVIEARAESTIVLDIPLTVRTETKKALYRVFITDNSGSVVYVFPDHLVENPQEFRLSKYKLKLPVLNPGQYKVHTNLIYWFNPFKNGTVEFDVASLVIQ